jgi:hypothetical protein
MIYSFCGLYTTALDNDISISFPEEMMKRYQKMGINAVWMPVILYQVTEFPFDKSYSKGYEKRQERLRELVALGEKYGIPVYTTAEIHKGINKSYCMTEKLSTCVRYIEKETPIQLKNFQITCFEVPHDGTDNVGYCIEADGRVFSFLTDLGEITPTAAHYINKANHLVIEANYDEEMLKMGPYPQHLKVRISSPNGHMSNRNTADFLAENMTEQLKNIWLCHLSKDNNHPELALKTFEIILRSKGIIIGKDVQLAALKRHTPSEFHEFE